MHQTFYIDIDEEITSVVERLRKARASEIIMVVPKRALLIQSIVNLRLLKKEAENLGFQLMIVTQDKLGKLLVEKAGILVQQKLDETLGEDILPVNEATEKIDMPEDNTLEDEGNLELKRQAKNRLDNLGSENFFDERKKNVQESLSYRLNPSSSEENKSQGENENITNKELVSGIGSDIRKPELNSPRPRVNGINTPSLPGREESVNHSNFNAGPNRDMDIQEKKLEKFFHHTNYQESDKNQEKKEINNFKSSEPGVTKRWRTVGLSLVVIILLGAVAAVAYFFVPNAVISLTISEKSASEDCEVRGDVKAAAVDLEGEVIPAQLVSVNEEISETFPSSGSKSVSNQKARGTVTIYNEYSSSEQPLVATTRFLTEDGKLFRLVKGVTVPGTIKEGSDIKPGTVGAEIVADESGESYNIGPSKFSIPGFKDSGNDKYNKIYAESSKSMTGGGNSKDESKTITEEDVTKAKMKMNASINKKIVEKIKATAGENAVVLEEAINKEEATYKLSNLPGEVIDNFEIKSQIVASALVFREDDLQKVVGHIIAKSKGGKTVIDSKSIKLEYGKLDSDFKTGFVNIRVHGEGKIIPDIDLDDFKNRILGKSNEEFETILNDYTDIEKAEITYWPPFISESIPRYGKRVEIEIKSENSSNN